MMSQRAMISWVPEVRNAPIVHSHFWWSSTYTVNAFVTCFLDCKKKPRKMYSSLVCVSELSAECFQRYVQSKMKSLILYCGVNSECTAEFSVIEEMLAGRIDVCGSHT